LNFRKWRSRDVDQRVRIFNALPHKIHKVGAAGQEARRSALGGLCRK
jgi:hypothetical protein